MKQWAGWFYTDSEEPFLLILKDRPESGQLMRDLKIESHHFIRYVYLDLPVYGNMVTSPEGDLLTRARILAGIINGSDFFNEEAKRLTEEWIRDWEQHLKQHKEEKRKWLEWVKASNSK